MTEAATAPAAASPVAEPLTTGAVSTPAPAPAAPAADAPFHASFEDASLKTWAEGKGWKSAEAAVKSAFHLEKMVGAPADSVLRVPQPGDVEGLARVREQLGMPKTAGEYDIQGFGDTEEGKAYKTHLEGTFHKAGLTKEQATAILAANSEYNGTSEANDKESYALSLTAEDNELRKEWGNGYETQKAIASQAANSLGFTEGMIDGLEQAIGYAETMKFMSSIGERLGEDKFVAGDPSGVSQVATPAQAQAAWNSFKGDPGNVAALTDKRNPGHAAAMAKKAEIFSVMYPPQ